VAPGQEERTYGNFFTPLKWPQDKRRGHTATFYSLALGP